MKEGERLSGLSVATLLAVAALLASCADETLKKDVEMLKQDVANLQKRLDAAQPPKREVRPFEATDVSVAGSPFLGQAKAPVTVVEFTDYRCPFCRRHANETLPQIVRDYVENGKVKYVVREMPLKLLHSDAEQLALAAQCAGEQGKYWEMHDRFFRGTGKPDPQRLQIDVKAAKLNAKAFRACMNSDTAAARVAQDVAEGTKLGINGTPSFFLGKTASDDIGKIRATQMLIGAQPYPAFKQAIDKLLEEKN